MKKLIIILPILALLCASGLLFLVAPMIPSSWEVTYQLDGKEKQAGVARTPLFANDLIFIELTGSVRDLQTKDRISCTSFMLRLEQQKIVVPVSPVREFLGIRYVHRDQLIGVDLTSPEVDDRWTVLFQEDQIIFGNPSIRIAVKKQV
ncbi:MAG: hypothetical protein ACI8Z5_000678 [Lentimonas sp.]|jgi:hypothetical protein